jgi:Flp pilus assembly protein TadG
VIRDERGTASVELALVGPVLMLLILGVLQFGLWYHAQQVVQSAASVAARVAAAEGAVDGEGEAIALKILNAGLGKASEVPQTQVSIEPDLVRVRVQAKMRGLLPIPGLSSLHLQGKASAYREHFRPEEHP